MNILVSNHRLKEAGGSETFTYTLIGELARQGYDVEYFCFEEGEYSERIKQDFNVKFCTKNHYDLILANHYTTVEHLYKKGFIIQTCHGIFPELERPSDKANGFVSISQEVQIHLLKKGINSFVIYNGIDCQRFRVLKPLTRGIPRVLSLCHSQEAHNTVQSACELLGFGFGIMDKYKNGKWEIEEIINNYDIVVGLGRSAYEAMACGRPVIFYDKRHYFDSFSDGYFLEVLIESIKNNCSGRALQQKVTVKSLANDLSKFNPKHGEIARKYALLSFNISKNTQYYLDYFEILKRNSLRNTFKWKLRKKINKINNLVSNLNGNIE